MFSLLFILNHFAVSLLPLKISPVLSLRQFVAFNTFVNHALHLCSTSELLNLELTYLKEVAMDRGFDSKIIDSIDSKLTKPNFKCKILNSSCINSVILSFFSPVFFFRQQID